MKHYFLLFSFIILLCPVYAQKRAKGQSKEDVKSLQSSIVQKKPTIMILPSDSWCEMRYFMTSYDNQGTVVKTPNYEQAFREDIELGPVISKIGEMLTTLGYSLKDAEQGIKSLNVKTAEENMMTSSNSGALLSESSLDILKRRLKSDILIQVSWSMSRSGNTFTIEAFDSYTNKRIATSTGAMKGEGSIADILYVSVAEYIKSFDEQMSNWYKDININGREINLTIRCWDNWDKNLESVYEGEELADCIQKWMSQKTVNGNFNLSDASENFLQFEQVRIPLNDENNIAIDARKFGTYLRKDLAKPPYNITSKVITRGLGEVIIILGEK